ncbi:MAG: sigma-70 family RNA polymerase sigma factor [Chloroflexota bacterium]|nr:sigma-70 family RNA polymerase sigma factor [Chloroflexota bacterium]
MREFKLREQSSDIQWLLDEADGQGYLTLDQILEIFPEAEDNAAALENLFTAIYEQGIEVYETEEEAKKAKNEIEEKLSGDGAGKNASNMSSIPINDSVGLYFTEMSRVPLLTYEQEVELAKQVEQGRKAQHQLTQDGHGMQKRAKLKHLIEQGEEARQHLIKANTRLVVSIAKRYRGHGMSFLDLIQAGNMGLIRAVDKFDHRRGNKFGTLATWWIRQAVTRTLAQQGRTIRIPVHMNDRIRKLYKTAQKLEQGLGRRATPEEIAEEMNLPTDKVRWMLRVSWRPLSLEKPVGEEQETELGNFIEDESAPTPAQTTEQHQLREDLEKMLTSIPPREARILRLRFGLMDNRHYTLEEIGNRIGVTRERVRQIERQALKRLRHPRRRRKLRGYLS